MSDEKRIMTPDEAEFFVGTEKTVSERVDRFLGSLGEKYRSAEQAILTDWEAVKYERSIVSPIEWLNSDEYLGVTGAKTFPLVKEEFYRVMTMDPRPMMLILMGGIGWGKTFFSALTQAWLIYELSCLRNPQSFYGLASNSRIIFMNMSVTKGHARRVMYAQLMAMFDDSVYFRDVFPRYRGTQTVITFPQKKITFIPGSSSELAPLGENMFGGVIEEANAFPVVRGSRKAPGSEDEEYDTALKLKDAIWRRMQSRFQRLGRIPGMLVLNSSAKYPDDFLERLAKESDPKEVVVIRHAEWETKPPDRYCGKKFIMFMGDVQTIPRIVDEGEEVSALKNSGANLMEIPVEYRSAFEKDPIGSLRDIAGVTVRAYDRFLPDDERIDAMFKSGEMLPRAFHNRWENGVVSDELNSAVHPGNLIRKELRLRPEEPPVALYHPEALRYCHIDLSSVGDATGIAIVHVGEVKEIEKLIDVGEGQKEVTREMVPVIFVDTVLKVTPPEKGEIEFDAIRELVHRFVEEAGFTFAKITFDQYQSRDSQQILRKRFGEDVVKPLSVDRTPDPYLVFKETLYEKRIACPFYAPLSIELRQLRMNHKTKKVDHLPTGSKDVSDALAGAVFLAVQNFDSDVGMEMSLGRFEDEATADDYQSRMMSWLMGVGPKPEDGADPQKPKKKDEIVITRLK